VVLEEQMEAREEAYAAAPKAACYSRTLTEAHTALKEEVSCLCFCFTCGLYFLCVHGACGCLVFGFVFMPWCFCLMLRFMM
jgi:hypothetical protein